MRQLVELQKHLKKLDKAGIEVAAVSYDPPKSLVTFAKKRKITYPVLADPQSKAIKAFGILNEKGRGFTAGIPHPGTIIVDQKGIVRAKIFLPGYRRRHSVDDLLKVVKELD